MSRRPPPSPLLATTSSPLWPLPFSLPSVARRRARPLTAALLACATRLRFELGDSALVDEAACKKAGALDVMKIGKGATQVIIGADPSCCRGAQEASLRLKDVCILQSVVPLRGGGPFCYIDT